MLDAQRTPLGDPSTTASTRGWDTVYAIGFSDVNSAIVRAGSSPATFLYTEADVSEPSQIEGTFSDWRLVSGSGRILTMDLPVPQMFIRDLGDGDEVERRDVTIQINLSLDLVPQPTDTARADGGTVHEFRPALSNTPGPFGASVVTVESVTYPANPPGHTQPSSDDDGLTPELIKILFFDWINDNENLQKFNHAFCAVNLNAKASKDEFDWLMPVHTSYSISPGVAGAEGVFAVLCMTGAEDDRRPVPTSQDISPAAIPPGKRSAFLISKERFLSKMVLPGVALNFAAPEDVVAAHPDAVWPKDYFELKASGATLANRLPIEMPNFQAREEDKPVTARLEAEGLELTMEDLYLEVNFNKLTHPYWWFWYEAKHDINMHASVMLTEDGKFMLTPSDPDRDDDAVDHTATLEITPTGQKVQLGILAVEIIGVLVPLAKAGWGTYLAKAAAKAGQGGTAGATIARGSAELAQVGMDTVTTGAKAGQLTLKNMLSTTFAKIYAGIFGAMGIGLIAEQVIQVIADNDDWAKNRIPDFKEFASEVMAPITWSGADDFAIDAVTFNGSFQASGVPLFAGETSQKGKTNA